MLDHDRGKPTTRRQFLRGLGAAGAGLLTVRALQVLAPAAEEPTSTGFVEGTRTSAPEAAAAGAAVEVIARQAWGAAPLGRAAPQARVEHLTVHHSGVVLRNNRRAPRQFREHLKVHLRQGRPDIAYHFLVDRHGNVYEGRPVTTQTDSIWGTYDVRGHLLVMCEGNFETQRIPAPQLDALTAVLAWASSEYEIDPATIRGHRVFAKTLCPGKHLNRLVNDGTVGRMVAKRRAGSGVRLAYLPLDASRDRLDEIGTGR